MPKQCIVKSLSGINWKDHYDWDNDIEFYFFFRNSLIQQGDLVMVENKQECSLPLDENQYCVTFSKDLEDGGNFFLEVPFLLEECKNLFGEDFDY